MEKEKLGFRQGDILFAPFGYIPRIAVPVEPEDDRLIAARGEATGHHHSFPHNRGAVLFRDDSWSGGTNLKLKVTEPVALEHQEHGALTAQPGEDKPRFFKGIRQRTFSSNTTRAVED